MLDNCFRFAPRDSVPGLIAKICKYLKDHPGWSEKELEEQIKQFVGQTGVESFNGRTGAVVLNESDVNNLKIASAYFAEGNETIEELNLVELYKQGIRFVFTNWNSATSGYDMSFVLDYFSGSGNVVYYPIASASDGSSESPVVSVNSMVGAVTIPVVDVSETDSKNQFAKIFINESEDYPIAPSYDSDRLGGKPPSYYAYAADVDYKLSKLNEANAAQDTEIAKKANESDLAAVAKSGSYADLTNKPTIPTVPSALPNPNALTFTGAVTGSYDGSAPMSVEIPSGGGGSSGGSGKAKSQILIDQEITELTASLSVTLEHDFHNLTAIINCGSAGAALTADSGGAAIAGRICLLIDTTDFSYNSRKVAQTDTSTEMWKSKMFGAEWSDDLSVFKRGVTAEIDNGKKPTYFFMFGGTSAMYGTLGTDDNAPRTGKTANIVVNGAYLNVGTRVVLWGEYYE